MKKFTITCNKCGSNIIIVSAYCIESMVNKNGVLPLPYLSCTDCGNEWNPQIKDELNNELKDKLDDNK